jgi:hypothetical protein
LELTEEREPKKEERTRNHLGWRCRGWGCILKDFPEESPRPLYGHLGELHLVTFPRMHKVATESRRIHCVISQNSQYGTSPCEVLTALNGIGIRLSCQRMNE